ncbi:MAG TPA: hypothetical protein PKI27_00670 [Dermatophilaceae bacterium]|jgi:hypothetical protein|nr:hypothetical protein [Dermatophilaceae bacterium]
MTTYTLRLDQVAGHFEKVQGDMRKAAMRGLLSAAQRTQQEIVLRIIPTRSPKPVDRAASGYLGGWRARPTEDGAVIENLETHAAFIEYGVKNVKVGARMIRMLSEWAVRKGLATAEDAVAHAWAIARLMRNRGIFNGGQGFGILKEATEKHVPRFVREEVARELQRL